MIAATAPESNRAPYLSGGDGMLQRFIGKPWQSGADGPDAFDCWGLVAAAALDLFGLTLPPLPHTQTGPQAIAATAREALTLPGWRECGEPALAAVIALCAYTGDVRHVGLCLSPTHCLHTARATRSCVVQIGKLRTLYPLARFYQWAP